MRINLSIRKRLLIALVLASIIPIIIISTLTLTFEKNAIINIYTHQSEVVARANQDKIEDYINKLVNTLKTLQNDADLIANFTALTKLPASTNTPETVKLRDNITKIVQPTLIGEGIVDFFMISKDNIVYYLSDNNIANKYIGLDLYKELGIHPNFISDTVFISEVFNDPYKNKNDSFSILLGGLIRDAAGKNYGVILFEVPMNNIYELLSAPGPGKTTQVMLGKITKNGILAASPLDYDYNTIFTTHLIKGNVPITLANYGEKGLVGKRIAIQKETTFEKYLVDNYGSLINIVYYNNTDEGSYALISGRADMLMLDTADANQWLQQGNNSERFQIIGQPIINNKYFGLGYGVVFRKDEIELLTAFNKALDDLRADGTYNKLVTKYFEHH